MKKFPITDHAILRYIERVLEIDIDQVKDKMRNEVKNRELRDGVLYKDGYSWLFRDSVLVSVVKGRANNNRCTR